LLPPPICNNSLRLKPVGNRQKPKKCPVETGQRTNSKMHLAPDAPAFNGKIDPRLCFLERAIARLILFETGLMSLDEAFDGLVGWLSCACDRERVERWERDYPPVRRPKKRAA
jgi:hypothetical protein